MSTGVSSPGAGQSRRGRRWAITVGLVLTLLAAGGIVVAWQSRAARPAPPEVDLADADPAVKRAIEAAQAAVRRAPGSADAWGRLGMVLSGHGFYSESVACFAEAQRLDPGERRWPYFLGAVLALSDPEAALPHLRRAVELCEPAASEPRLRLAEILLGQGRSREAEKLFREVTAYDPDNPRAQLGLAQLAYQQNDWASSLSHLHRAARSPLTQQRACTLRAEVFRRRGDVAAAERESRRASDLPVDPQPPDSLLEEIDEVCVGRQAHLARASRLLEQQQTAKAISLLEQLVRDYPDSASAWLGLGRALIQQKRYRAAEPALRRAAGLEPDRVEVQFYLGVSLFEQGRSRDAVGYFRRATELRPGYTLAYYNLGQCLKAQGDLQGAIVAFRAALRYKPAYAQAHADLGALLAQHGERDLAVKHLRLAVDLDPTDARAKALLEKWRH